MPARAQRLYIYATGCSLDRRGRLRAGDQHGQELSPNQACARNQAQKCIHCQSAISPQHQTGNRLLPAQAVAVDGRYSKFTVAIMTYESRLRLAQLSVRHYSRCPSVDEVVVIWNAGKVGRGMVQINC